MAFSECPIKTLRNQICSLTYNLIKSTLMSEMGLGLPPSKLLEEPNIYFVYRDVIRKAENDFEDQYKEVK